MLKVVYCILILSSVKSLNGLPERSRRDVSQKSIVGTATSIMATNILKGISEQNKNYVFSPLGYTSILAILSEGAKGDTLVDISSMLKHPEERSRVRLAYKNVLKSFQGEDPTIAPQFKTWLYIYKNNTVDDTFRTNIHENYFVEVKEIDRVSSDWEETASVEEVKPSDQDADLSHVENVKRDEKANQAVVPPVAVNAGNDTNSKDIPDFETLKKTQPVEDETRLIDPQKDSSKFDEVVEDRQYVEVPVIKEEISKQKTLDEGKPAETRDEEKITEKEKTLPKDDSPVPVDSAKKPAGKVESLEIMEAQARSIGERQFGSTNVGEVASAISGNSIVGKKTNSRQSEKEMESKMLLFNGLYYKGNWAIPFQQLRSESENVFYTSETEKVAVKMMRARGFYKIAECKNLKAKVIDLPYDNERYSFMVILPNSRDGLKNVLDDLTPNSFPEIIAKLEEESIDISIPKFSIDTTSGAEKNLAKNGLASIFTSKADFSGITTEQQLRIDELQQHVALRVDEGSSSENFLTAANALRSNAQPEQSIVVDRPFLFFVRDVADGTIIMAGKIVSPPIQTDEPSF